MSGYSRRRFVRTATTPSVSALVAIIITAFGVSPFRLVSVQVTLPVEVGVAKRAVVILMLIIYAAGMRIS